MLLKPTHATDFTLHLLYIFCLKCFFVLVKSYLINRGAMEKRREINIHNGISNLGNALKRLRYEKADKRKIGKYVIALLVLKYRNDPTNLKYE